MNKTKKHHAPKHRQKNLKETARHCYNGFIVRNLDNSRLFVSRPTEAQKHRPRPQALPSLVSPAERAAIARKIVATLTGTPFAAPTLPAKCDPIADLVSLMKRHRQERGLYSGFHFPEGHLIATPEMIEELKRRVGEGKIYAIPYRKEELPEIEHGDAVWPLLMGFAQPPNKSKYQLVHKGRTSAEGQAAHFMKRHPELFPNVRVISPEDVTPNSRIGVDFGGKSEPVITWYEEAPESQTLYSQIIRAGRESGVRFGPSILRPAFPVWRAMADAELNVDKDLERFRQEFGDPSRVEENTNLGHVPTANDYLAGIRPDANLHVEISAPLPRWISDQLALAVTEGRIVARPIPETQEENECPPATTE